MSCKLCVFFVSMMCHFLLDKELGFTIEWGISPSNIPNAPNHALSCRGKEGDVKIHVPNYCIFRCTKLER